MFVFGAPVVYVWRMLVASMFGVYIGVLVAFLSIVVLLAFFASIFGFFLFLYGCVLSDYLLLLLLHEPVWLMVL